MADDGGMRATRRQQSYDYRLRDLVRRTGDMSVATELGVPRSTARGWITRTPRPVVTLDAGQDQADDLRRELQLLRRRVQKLTALLRLVIAVLQVSGFTFRRERLPEGRSKRRVIRAVEHSRRFVPAKSLMRFLGLSPSRFHDWRRRDADCALDDQASCPRSSPHRLTSAEIKTIKDMVTSSDYRHVPTGTLAVLAQRLGKVFASPSTWHSLVRKFKWRRPRARVHPAKPKVGIRTTRPDELWHIDTTVIRLLDGTRAYPHAVIDNFSRRILAWRVADTFSPASTVSILLEASKGVASFEETPMVMADAGGENFNGAVDELVEVGILRRVLAYTELKFSNSMIEAWWRSLEHQWLFLHSLDRVATVRRLVEFYVPQHNAVLPHSAFRGQTPDEVYFGTGDDVPGDLDKRKTEAPKTLRAESNGNLPRLSVQRRRGVAPALRPEELDHPESPSALRSDCPVHSLDDGRRAIREPVRVERHPVLPLPRHPVLRIRRGSPIGQSVAQEGHADGHSTLDSPRHNCRPRPRLRRHSLCQGSAIQVHRSSGYPGPPDTSGSRGPGRGKRRPWQFGEFREGSWKNGGPSSGEASPGGRPRAIRTPWRPSSWEGCGRTARP